MLNRKSIILSVLVVASLNCSQPYGIVKAAEEFKEIEWKQVIIPGTASSECKPLEIPHLVDGKPAKPALAIKVYRHQETLCVYAVYEHYTWNCSDTGTFIHSDKPVGPRPVAIYSGSGNQICPGAILLFKNSPGCWEIDSGGGNTYFVPRG